MIVLFMTVSIIIGCVDRVCQSFFSECFFLFFFSFLFNHSFWPCCHGLLTFPCLWEMSFSS